MKRLVVGFFAQVDAGKTTLTEALLYTSGQRKMLGRVDHGDAFLDTHSLERARGITIFSKQARIRTDELELTLVDTPGHIDFSPEAERTMQILDYAVMLISGTDGVQAHTETLWKLLRHYHVPTFLFFNKMDLAGCDRARLLSDAATHLSPKCLDLTDSESVALCSDTLLEHYLEHGDLPDDRIAEAVAEERLFPCFFGSALKLDGIDAFWEGLSRFTRTPKYSDEFSALVYQITHDSQGNRLTFMKITGGVLHVRDSLHYTARDGTPFEEKVSQLRLYSGRNFTQVQQVTAGEICAVPGLTALVPSDTLGAVGSVAAPLLAPVMSYRIVLPDGYDTQKALQNLRRLEAEEPQLHIVWEPLQRQIRAQLMGQVQMEVLQSLLRERFSMDVSFDSGRVSYRETIGATVEGVGHFEPLRHYAEVHLLLEPLPIGSGLVFATDCSEDRLDRNWQRLILTHLEEKTHLGVLTGSPITDMRITLVDGRAHLKHTEGGDFRQTTYRAVRQGLMQAESILLEPFYRFTLTVPAEQLGRAINDIRAMGGTFEAPQSNADGAVLTGRAPVAKLQSYMSEIVAYTRGKGKLVCQNDGYAPCRDAAEVIHSFAYDPTADPENTPDSVFCSHGAGVNIRWDKVAEHMHLPSYLKPPTPQAVPTRRERLTDMDEKALQAIMEREFGPEKHILYRQVEKPTLAETSLPPRRREYLIVDGYNMIFAWDGLREQAQSDLSGARDALLSLLSNYCGYHPCELVVVFDSYRVKGGFGSKTRHENLRVVFTQANESADMYIEALVNEIGKNYAVRVATSDALIQLSALRSGVLRVSAQELLREIEQVNEKIAEVIWQLREQSRRASIRDNPMRRIQTEEKP